MKLCTLFTRQSILILIINGCVHFIVFFHMFTWAVVSEFTYIELIVTLAFAKLSHPIPPQISKSTVWSKGWSEEERLPVRSGELSPLLSKTRPLAMLGKLRFLSPVCLISTTSFVHLSSNGLTYEQWRTLSNSLCRLREMRAWNGFSLSHDVHALFFPLDAIIELGLNRKLVSLVPVTMTRPMISGE